MGNQPRSVRVAILVTRDTTLSVTYGMYDLFKSAGRDWGLIVDGVPGPSVIDPVVVSAEYGPLVAANGVRVTPGGRIDDEEDVDVVCVPELLVSPGEPVTGRYSREVKWIRGDVPFLVELHKVAMRVEDRIISVIDA